MADAASALDSEWPYPDNLKVACRLRRYHIHKRRSFRTCVTHVARAAAAVQGVGGALANASSPPRESTGGRWTAIPMIAWMRFGSIISILSFSLLTEAFFPDRTVREVGVAGRRAIPHHHRRYLSSERVVGRIGKSLLRSSIRTRMIL